MFIDTIGTIIKTVVTTKHFTRILRINSSQISLFLYIHFFGFSPDATRTQYLAHTCTRQSHLRLVSITMSLDHTHCCSPPQLLLLVSPRICSRIRCSTKSSVACEPKNPHYLLDTPCIAVRGLPHYPLIAHSLTVGWLPRHPLAVSQWKNLIAICCSSAASP